MPFLWLNNGIKITIKPPVRHKYQGNRAWRAFPFTENQMVLALIVGFLVWWLSIGFAMKADLAATSKGQIIYEVPNDPR